jgi:hypothetical protein
MHCPKLVHAPFLAVSLLAAFMKPGSAHACGGFFCSQVPVVQNGEQIVFAVGDNHVTAHIRIFYTGDAKKFAWVVPVPSIPKISVGTETLFSQLASATQPQFRLNLRIPDDLGTDSGALGQAKSVLRADISDTERSDGWEG